jgi:hypothetical protein
MTGRRYEWNVEKPMKPLLSVAIVLLHENILHYYTRTLQQT